MSTAQSRHRPFIVRAGAKLFVPIALLWAAHLFVAGFSEPGGGVIAGMAFAAAIILYGLVFGADAALHALPPLAARLGAGLGVLGLLGLGAAGMARGGAFFDHGAAFGGARFYGAALFEIAAATTIACSFVLAYQAIASRAGDLREQDW